MSDSALRIDLALRAALMAKAALDIVNLDPRLVPLQLAEVAKQMLACEKKLAESGVA